MSETVELGHLEASLRAVDAVGSVVHAVWALARAQLPRAEEAVAEGTEYLDWVDAVVDRIAGAPREAEASESLTIVVGPERAFCGPLARSTAESIPPAGPVGLVGSRLAEVALRDHAIAQRVAFTLAGASSVDELPDTATRLAAAVLAHGADAPVEVVHLRGRATHRVILLAMEREGRAIQHELYSPREAVLHAAVREGVTGRVRLALAETLLVELRARVLATERARRAAKERRAQLEASWRIGQRDQITRELMELTGALLSIE